MITLYTRNNCMPCKMTKNILSENKVDFTVKNVDEDNDNLVAAQSTGFTSLPIVLQDDVVIASGFQPEKLKPLYESIAN